MRLLIVKDLIADVQRERTVNAVYAILSKVVETKIVSEKEIISSLKNGDIIFNLAIGKRKDFLQGDIAAVAQMLGHEYIGSPPYTHYVCLDKFATKSILNSYKIKTPTGALFDGKNFIGKLSTPSIIKPVAEGSGIGIDDKSLCNNIDEIRERAISKFEELGEPILIEEFLDGREITVGVIGFEDDLIVLPELEIDFSHLPNGIERYYSQRVKEKYGQYTIYKCPSTFSQKIRDQIHATAIKTFKAVQARDYLRIDMRVVEGVPYVIEVNSMPGLDPLTSDLPKMVKPLNKDYEWLIKTIVKRVVEVRC